MPVKQSFVFLFVCAFRCIVAAQFSHPAFHYTGSDSVVVNASNRYKAHSFLRHWLMGKNYRSEWEQPVTLPVLRLSATPFRIIELGGGMQTKSLKLEDDKGKTWALRTIEKDVSGAMPPLLKNSLAQKLTQDQISAAMPYGVLVIGPLAKAAGIRAAQPTIYFVADDTALGPYRSIFANTMCMLEERDPGVETSIDTETLLRLVQKENSAVVDQKALLKARLLDMLIADWDRHYDNWRWASRDSAGLRFFEAIPRDRDWAFYSSNGLVPKLMRLVALRFLINFQEKPGYIRSLSSKAHLFDGVFLNGLAAEDWRTAIHELQQLLTDKAIENAVANLPASILTMDGESFVRKLKKRRDGLEEPVLDYYRFLAKDVQVDGSNEDELFYFLPAENGFVLRICRYAKENGREQTIYERRFLRSETYRVTINGLAGNDRFVITENVATRIRLKLNGGSGQDQYDLRGQVPTEVHDEQTENNIVRNKNSARICFH
ncbi:hypothetical protein [Flavisolibacter nicotianae]|uniref:hypothetical protein n=1 Tax=Flavisolibacter nicotianae TaxID=2364882 RepID=UPI000EAF6D05|nr:hypothetical protein [Flavisolibacter nicotianae]